MTCFNFLKLFVPALIGSVFSDQCGSVYPRQQNVAAGTTVQFRLTEVSQAGWIQWHYVNNTLNSTILLCDSKTKHCVTSNKYTMLGNGYELSITSVTHSDSGDYVCYCYNNRGYKEWSSRGALNVKREITSAHYKQVTLRKNTSIESTNEDRSMTHSTTAKVKRERVKTDVTEKTSASNDRELHQKTISTESTNEYHSSMTNSAIAKVESGSVKTEVSDSATDYKASSTLQDTSQVITILVAGGVAVGVLVTVTVVAIICKKQKKDVSHQASRKSGPTQTNSEGAEGQDNSFRNDSTAGLPHSRKPSERDTSVVRHEALHSPGTSYDQQESSSAAELINSEYATIVTKKDRISSTQQRETNKVVVKEEEGALEYATVVKSRHPGCIVEQSTKGGKDKNERGLVYADLDLVSRPKTAAASKEHEATEYVSINFQKTATLKSQQK